MKRAHVKGDGSKETLCGSKWWPSNGASQPRIVTREEIVKMKMGEACQRCYRVVQVANGVRFVRS